VRVAIIGGGGFRVPTMYESVRSVGSPAISEVALHDVSEDRLRWIADVLEGLRAEAGGPSFRTTTSLDDAVDGASFVWCAIRVGGLEGRVIDETVPLRYGVLGQETVGSGGIAFALRTVPVMDRVAHVVARRAPDAWFLNFTNPAGLVTEALTETLGPRVVGICDSPSALCARVASELGLPVSSLEFGYSGSNHLGWLTAVLDEGHDRLPELLSDEQRLRRLEEGRLFGTEGLCVLGMIPNEYLAYYERPTEIAESFRRTGTRGEILRAQQAGFYEASWDTPAAALAAWRATRDLRHGTYMDEAHRDENAQPSDRAQEAPDDDAPGEAGYAAIARWLLEAIGGKRPRTMILNLPNGGRMPGLPDAAVVETPVRVERGVLRPLPVPPLPPAQADLVARVKGVERLTIQAARTHSVARALEAMAAHPLVPSRDVAERILVDYLRLNDGLRAVIW
jgi:6-phospho-beta-glucosidase